MKLAVEEHFSQIVVGTNIINENIWVEKIQEFPVSTVVVGDHLFT